MGKTCWESAWSGLERHPVACLTILYLLCAAVFIAAIPLPRVDGQLTGSDGAFYYSYLPSLLLDRDLDFSNQYSVLVPAEAVAGMKLSPAGRPHNKSAIGTAILWTPFFLIGHCLALGLRAAGCPVQPDGMGYVYQIPTLLGSITYGFAGILLVYRSCCRFFSRPSSVSAAVLIWLATNLIYYMVAEPSMSHACSFFAAALFLKLWLSFRPVPRLFQWIVLGLSGGLIALVRQPDATWLALPVFDMLLSFRAAGPDNFRRNVRGLLVFGIVAGTAFLPQMAIWRILNGSALQTGYSYAGEGFNWLSPRILSVLFSLHHGLYSWHPVLLAATAGLLLVYRRHRILAFSLGLIFACQAYLIGAWLGWSGGHSFGSRMLISSLPALAPGLAALIERAAARRALPAICLLAAGLIVWNALFFAQYRFGYISKQRSITFYQLTVGKLVMLKDLVILDFGLRIAD